MSERAPRRAVAPHSKKSGTAPASVLIPEPGTIYDGDCVDVMRAWPDAIFDACITDPPYNMSRRKGLKWAFSSHVTMEERWDSFTNDEYFDFTRRWMAEVCRLVRPNGNILVFGSFHNIYLIGFVLEHVLRRRILQQITWFKPNAQPNITGRLPTESTEYILWACNNTPDRAAKWTFDYASAKVIGGGKQLRNLWSIPCTPRSERASGSHPSQKPAQLLERIVTLWTKPQDLILDCFLGTGTTAVVASRLGRRWVGIEKDRGYIEIAKSRLAAGA
ncbi:MAG TPA: site-specific DNA-methyltransferase [Candidatus Acidoferrales bacterium]|nr:site-specific DNA-methyltransferase [Candidatus Acidoferrales bacterium]